MDSFFGAKKKLTSFSMVHLTYLPKLPISSSNSVSMYSEITIIHLELSKYAIKEFKLRPFEFLVA